MDIKKYIILLLIILMVASVFAIDHTRKFAGELPQLTNQSFIHQANGKISLNFQNITVRAALQILAEFSGINLVVSDSVTGTLTINIHNISWDQILNIILQMHGLDKRKFANVWLIAPTEEIAAHERQILLAHQQISKLEPLHSALIQINYANAKELAELLRNHKNSLLSEHGSVNVDARTNTIWLQDTSVKLIEIRNFIKKLDVPVKQVLIAARIAVINKNYERELGIRWDVNRTSNLTSSFSNNDSASQNQPNTPAANRLKVDLPIVSAIPGGAGLGVVLAKLGNDVLLDLELSALESENFAKIIASPRIITASQQEARIATGEEIPYQEATLSGGTAVSFKKAVLSLNVRPQITPDNRIILTLKITQDSKGAESGGVPIINTREIQTRVLINNGQTLVLGGIYEMNSNNSVHRIPFLGSLPVIGELFKHTANQQEQTELLIFITPKIIRGC